MRGIGLCKSNIPSNNRMLMWHLKGKKAKAEFVEEVEMKVRGPLEETKENREERLA